MKAIAIGLSLLMFVTACTGISLNGPVYWNEDSTGVSTNDAMRLQKELPFKIILPGYLPSDLKGAKPSFVKINPKDGKVLELIIYYYSDTTEIQLFERWLSKPASQEDIQDLFSQFGSLELKGAKIYELSGQKTLLRSRKRFVVESHDYVWFRDRLEVLGAVYGYSRAESLKVIESMLE